MAGLNLHVGPEGEADSMAQEEAALEGADFALILELPDGSILEQVFKSGVNVEWVSNIVSTKTDYNFNQIDLYLEEKKLLGPMSLVDYPQIQSGSRLRVVIREEESKS